jgi:hypothetical protein
MSPVPQISRWQEGPVDRTQEHFELRYGSANKGGWDDWIPIAVIGPPTAGTVNVQFLVDPLDPRNANFIIAAKKEIEFFLIEKGELDPWHYAQYHCGTASNAYSDVHWSFFKTETEVAEGGQL